MGSELATTRKSMLLLAWDKHLAFQAVILLMILSLISWKAIFFFWQAKIFASNFLFLDTNTVEQISNIRGLSVFAKTRGKTSIG